MEKLPLFVRGLYGTTTKKTGDRQILSVNEYVVIDVFYELSCRIAQELWSSQKVASFEEIDTFWWFFTKCHSFCNFLLKICSKP